jgi:MFS family permease
LFSNKSGGKPRIYFGWWTVLALGIESLVGMGFAFQAFSVVFKPLATELGLSRAVTSLASSTQGVVGAFFVAIGGWAADKYGPRWLILTGISIISIGCILMYFVSSLWSFILVMGLIGAGAALGITYVTDKAIVNWFVKKSGIAINLKFALASLSGFVILPFAAWLVTNHGWRFTYVVGGIIVAVVCIPLVWFFVKSHRPEYYGLLPDGETKAAVVKPVVAAGMKIAAGAEDKEFTFRQAVKTLPFWLILTNGYIIGMIGPMMGVHCIPFLTDRGISPVEAAAMVGLMGTIGIPARLITGSIVDRLQTKHLRFLMAAGTFLQAIGVITFLIGNNTASIYSWFVLYGIGGTVNGSVSIPLLARYFGRKSFGAIAGFFQPLLLPVMLIAPVYVGWVFDTSGSYMSIIYLMAVLITVSGVITCFMAPPKIPAGAKQPVRTTY